MSDVVITVTPAASDFARAIGRYVNATSKRIDDVLEKKGRDIGIRLYQAFSARKWGGAGLPQKGLARAEMARRTEAGKGIKVRESVMAEYLAQRAILRSEADSLNDFVGPHNKRSKGALDRKKLKSIKARVSLWQDFVGKELALRQGGIGVLAASFLWFRKRTNAAMGTFLVRNKTSRKVLGSVDHTPGLLTISGFTDGLSTIDERYGIVSRVLADVAADMLPYIQRKEIEAFGQTFEEMRK